MQNKLSLFSLLMLILWAPTISAGTIWVTTSEVLYANDATANPNVSFYTQSDSVGGTGSGAFGFLQLSPGWGQMYGGLTRPITSVWSIGAGLGVEQGNSFKLRVGLVTSVIGHPRYYLLGIYELGQEKWWRLTARYKFNPAFEFGPAGEHNLGTGVSTAWNLPNRWYLPSTLAATYLAGWDGRENNLIVATSKLF